MWQLIVRSSTPTSGEALNIWNSTAVDPDTAADALHTWYEGVNGFCSDDATFDIDPVAREIDPTSGVTLGLASVTWSAVVPGAGAGVRGPDASAVLVAHDTGVFINGRRLQGRTFLPYPSLSVLGEGQIAALALGTFQDALDLAQSTLTFGSMVIWHRPHPILGAGSTAPISASTVRREYSYQGKRRD